MRTIFRPPGRRERAGSRGQALVEFGLVLPLLMVFFLGVADFGRVFADGIALEAAARNSAEAAAQEYLQFCAKYAGGDCSLLVQGDYDDLHALALDVGCRESERLSNVQEAGGVCTNPLIAVCVHDDTTGDTNNCGDEASGAPAECSRMTAAWSPVRSGPPDGRPYVEVRMCYLFDPLVPLTEGWWGDVRLQRENNFAVTNY
jgi:hypothetical protein